VGLFGAIVGTLALDLRLEPNPRLLKREFIELIRPEREGGGGKSGGINQCAGAVRCGDADADADARTSTGGRGMVQFALCEV
jgi:hypothetical protein